MSSVYLSEPPTKGKVVLVTSVGEIEIELWAKEAPLACRNFVQLCMEGYYDNTIFHRLVKDFILQGGDPTGTGKGGESIWGAPFNDEFHSRIRFNHRGKVAMANSGVRNSNQSQFFITLSKTEELERKYSIFGKIVGDTIFNVLKVNDLEVDTETERPLYPPKLLSTRIVWNPFEDIIPRDISHLRPEANEPKKKKKEKPKAKKIKDFKLLSFGEEAEEEEKAQEGAIFSSSSKLKMTSSIPKVADSPLPLDNQNKDIKEDEKQLAKNEKLESLKNKVRQQKQLSEKTTTGGGREEGEVKNVEEKIGRVIREDVGYVEGDEIVEGKEENFDQDFEFKMRNKVMKKVAKFKEMGDSEAERIREKEKEREREKEKEQRLEKALMQVEKKKQELEDGHKSNSNHKRKRKTEDSSGSDSSDSDDSDESDKDEKRKQNDDGGDGESLVLKELKDDKEKRKQELQQEQERLKQEILAMKKKKKGSEKEEKKLSFLEQQREKYKKKSAPSSKKEKSKMIMKKLAVFQNYLDEAEQKKIKKTEEDALKAKAEEDLSGWENHNLVFQKELRVIDPMAKKDEQYVVFDPLKIGQKSTAPQLSKHQQRLQHVKKDEQW